MNNDAAFGEIWAMLGHDALGHEIYVPIPEPSMEPVDPFPTSLPVEVRETHFVNGGEVDITYADWERWRASLASGQERRGTWKDFISIGTLDVEPTTEEVCPLCGKSREKCINE